MRSCLVLLLVAGCAANTRSAAVRSRQPAGKPTGRGAVVIANRMAPPQGVAILRACGQLANANDVLVCSRNDPGYAAFRSAWPDVPGMPASSANVGWFFRVFDAGLKGNVEWKGRFVRMQRCLGDRLRAAAPAERAALVAAVTQLRDAINRAELTSKLIDGALHASCVASGDPLTQLFSVFNVTMTVGAIASRKCVD